MMRVLLMGSTLLMATSASALTCAPPDPFRSFAMAQESPERYVVLYGRLSFDPAALPDGPELPAPGASETALDPVEARFDGHALGRDGFTRAVSSSVLLRPVCLGQFCASIEPGEGWLLFAQPSNGSYTLDVEPCSAWAFDQVPEATLDGLAGCLRGEACGAP